MDAIRKYVKSLTHIVAKWINNISNGTITANQITVTSLLLHIPIFFAIVGGYNWLAAIMIVIFGLLDSVDGELARLQGRVSKVGMLLDASTDRMKEAIIFMAIALGFALDDRPWAVLIAVAAITGSMSVSYIKAKGETALKDSKLSTQEINRVFQSGLMRYEVRMAVLVLGLILNRLMIAVALIAILSWLTALYRLVTISKKIED